MSAIEAVPVYYLSQNEVWEKPLRFQTRDELHELKRQGLGRFISNGRAFRLFERAPSRPQSNNFEVAPQNSLPPATTISLGEVLANVGIVEDSSPIGTVERARLKVKLYPDVFDDQAVLAYRSWTPLAG